MAGLTDDGRNLVADAKADLVTEISLHSGAPGQSGDNEVSGGGYARQTPTYDSASGGTASLSAPLSFDGPSEQSVSAIGFWAGSTFLGSDDSPGGDSAFNVDGEFQVDQADITST